MRLFVVCGALGYVQRWSALNERQLGVLRRIGEGKDPVGSGNPELATTVYALRNRGLVVTPRRDGGWCAEITDAGRFYLEHGHHPDRPDPGTEAARTPRPVGRPTTQAPSARELIEQVQKAGGTLRVENPDDETRAAYRRAIHAAKRNGLVPDTLQLRHTGRTSGDLIVQLSGDSPEEETEWNRIRLSTRDRVCGSSDLIAMLESDPALLQVSDEARPRALNLVRDLAGHAERRGHRLVLSKKRRPRGLFLQVGDDRRIGVTISEETEERPRELSAAERRKRGVYAWQRVTPEYETVFTGRLKIQLALSRHADKHEWSDGKARVESKLGEIVKAVERCVERDERERLEQQRQYEEYRAQQAREEAEKKARWEAAMAKARELAVEEHRGTSLAAALDSWSRAHEIRIFCEALETAATEAGDPERADELRRWITWALGIADRLDPTKNPSLLNGFEFEPTADDLRPHLDDWSPKGPYQEYRRPEAPVRPVSDAYREVPWFARRGRAQWWRR